MVGMLSPDSEVRSWSIDTTTNGSPTASEGKVGRTSTTRKGERATLQGDLDLVADREAVRTRRKIAATRSPGAAGRLPRAAPPASPDRPACRPPPAGTRPPPRRAPGSERPGRRRSRTWPRRGRWPAPTAARRHPATRAGWRPRTVLDSLNAPPVSCQATASAARSMWTSAADEKAPSATVVSSTSRMGPPPEPRAACRSASAGTRSRRQPASAAAARIASG